MAAHEWDDSRVPMCKACGCHNHPDWPLRLKPCARAGQYNKIEKKKLKRVEEKTDGDD